MKRFKKHIRKYDEHGVAQYNMLMIFGLMIVIALSIALTAANILFSFEYKTLTRTSKRQVMHYGLCGWL